MTNDNTDHRLRLAAIEPEEYDALADLFLGESVLAPEGAAAGRDEHAEYVERVAVVVDDDFYDEEVLIDLPEPPARFVEPKPLRDEAVREEPVREERVEPLVEFIAPPVQVIGRIAPEPDDEENESVDLPIAVCAGISPMVEVVLLGHLPVRATLWVRQYACAVARETGETVALIRAASGSTAVDLITGNTPVESRAAVSISHALEKAVHLADRVILRVDESAEPELLEREEIDQVTILTGADETAVVASYRLIKTLTASWDWADGNAPTLRMAVMGGTKAQSTDARAKLTRAVESFLDHPIEIVVSAGRIDATGTMNLYRDEVAHPAAHILDALTLPIEVAVEDAPAAVQSPMDLLREDIDALEAIEALTSRARDESENETDGAMEPVFERSNTLSGLVAGLRILEARCPTTPGVELAVDEHGRVHMVCDDSGANPVARLMSAQAWVREHLALLLRAEDSIAVPSADQSVDTDPTLHLLAEHPRELMAVYPTSVRVYALASVQVGGVVARVATAIN